ncbi:V-type proton ATPase subunit S1 [Phlebotomus argentipes]|uniref:V-type proton ATPase subunit S1 n=1 Tax=Phlebotomus argentipes TaxID=94469 RepID=UPI002892D18D|nr:V-type proton ATPase subunit S1 [Phlebotomus argentipes]
MRTLVKCLLLVFCANVAFGFEGVPLLLWGSTQGKTLSPPAINSLASGNILTDNIVSSQYTVVFVGDKLSPEALNECGEKNCFPYLENVQQKTYFANVENPIGLLATVGDDRKTEWVNAGHKLTPQAGKITFVTLTPGDFNTQDAEIAQAVKEIEATGENNAVFVYTAQHNDVAEESITARRIKRETTNKQDEATDEPFVFFRDNETYIISYSTISFEAPQASPMVLNFTSATVARLNDSEDSGFALNLVGEGPQLTFEIHGLHGRWWVEKLIYDEKEFYLNTYIGTHIGFSFACTPTSIFISKDEVQTNQFNRLHITRLQLEPRFSTDATEPFNGFSEPWDCVGFISPGIMGGLFVAILLLVILAAGLSWIMEIRTMDRFDDIKGKTITINVNE